MVGIVTLERRVGSSYETVKTFLHYVSPAQLFRLAKSSLYGSSQNNAQTAHINGKPAELIEPSNPELPVILEDPQWETANTQNRKEALVVGSLAKLGYHSASGLYNPKGRHAIFGSKDLLVSLDVIGQTYTPANGSIPHDMNQVLNRAGFKPSR